MNEVRLDLKSYNELKSSNLAKAERIDALEHELERVKSNHEEELDALAKEGKVRIVEKPFASVFELITRRKQRVRYKGFNDVKLEVEEHFKQGLFDRELEKQKQEELANLIRQNAERDARISDLEAEIKRIKSRSLWERIKNK